MKFRLLVAIALYIAFVDPKTNGIEPSIQIAESVVSSDVDSAGLSKAAATIQTAIDTTVERRRLGDGDRTPNDGTACDCSKDAMLDLSNAHQDVLQHVPLTMMGILENKKEVISNGATYEPVFDYTHLVAALETIWREASRQLSAIQCGPCDVDDDSSPEPPHRNETGSCPGISHYECCCDVELIRDIAIRRMYAVKEIMMLKPMAANFTKVALEAATRDTVKIIVDVSKPYNDCVCPCFSRSHLEGRTGFDQCSIGPRPDLKYAVDFDDIPAGSMFEFGVCVSENCRGFTNNVGSQMQCFSGNANIPDWGPDVTIININPAQEVACKNIIISFCEAMNDSIMMPFKP